MVDDSVALLAFTFLVASVVTGGICVAVMGWEREAGLYPAFFAATALLGWFLL